MRSLEWALAAGRTVWRAIAHNSVVLASDKRWRLMPAGALVVSVLVVFDFGNSKWGIGEANQWDLMLAVFNDPFKAMVLLPVGFFALVADTITRDWHGWGYLSWSRYKYRLVWWVGKLGGIALAVLMYLSILVIIVLITSAVAATVEVSWSTLVHVSEWTYPGGLAVDQLDIPPGLIMLEMLGLMSVGLISLGTVVAVIAFWARQPVIAWICGVVMAGTSYGVWLAWPWAAVWAPTLHLALGAHAEISNRVPGFFTIGTSLLFFMGLWLLAAVLGYVRVVRQDF